MREANELPSHHILGSFQYCFEVSPAFPQNSFSLIGRHGFFCGSHRSRFGGRPLRSRNGRGIADAPECLDGYISRKPFQDSSSISNNSVFAHTLLTKHQRRVQCANGKWVLSTAGDSRYRIKEVCGPESIRASSRQLYFFRRGAHFGPTWALFRSQVLKDSCLSVPEASPRIACVASSHALKS
jgi:hypothetical protein